MSEISEALAELRKTESLNTHFENNRRFNFLMLACQELDARLDKLENNLRYGGYEETS